MKLDVSSLAHTKRECKYHIIFAPKYRRQVIYGKIKQDIGQMLRKLCEYKGIEIIEAEACKDHIHMLVSIPPKYSVSQIMGYLKGKSSLMIYEKYANMKYKYGNRHFWCRGYYVSTVGLNEATIRKYIREQEKEDILEEIQKLKEDNYQEVTLLGQNVNAYGKDLYDNYSMAELLEDVAKIGIPRVRFMTSHPWDFTDSMIDVIAKYDNIMPSVHLPVQAGSDRILKLMGRRYNIESYLTLFHKMKERIKNCAISTDIIVGFPTESEEDFQKTLDLVNECKYDNAFTFIYSPRENTPAAKMKDDIALSEKEERLYKLNEIVNTYFLENNKKLEGVEVEVLVEGKSLKKNEEYFGYTDTNKLVNIKNGNDDIIGKIVKVKITDAKTWSLDGEYVSR